MLTVYHKSLAGWEEAYVAGNRPLAFLTRRITCHPDGHAITGLGILRGWVELVHCDETYVNALRICTGEAPAVNGQAQDQERAKRIDDNGEQLCELIRHWLLERGICVLDGMVEGLNKDVAFGTADPVARWDPEKHGFVSRDQEPERSPEELARGILTEALKEIREDLGLDVKLNRPGDLTTYYLTDPACSFSFETPYELRPEFAHLRPEPPRPAAPAPPPMRLAD